MASCPVCASQTLTVPFHPPDTMRVPSAESAMLSLQSLRLWSCLPSLWTRSALTERTTSPRTPNTTVQRLERGRGRGVGRDGQLVGGIGHWTILQRTTSTTSERAARRFAVEARGNGRSLLASRFPPRQLPAHHFQMRLVVLASIRVGRDQRAVL